MLQCAVVSCSMLQCATVCCSVLRYVAVCCSVLHCTMYSTRIIQRERERVEERGREKESVCVFWNGRGVNDDYVYVFV